jgi:Na+/H+ antiporter NhaC
MKTIILVILCVLLNGCSGFSLLISGSSIAISQNVYSKAYSGVDVITIIQTDKSIKEHAYDKIKKK